MRIRILTLLLIELQNHVYDYCIPEAGDEQSHLAHRRQSELGFFPGGRHRTRPYLGLTQVSQVIRAEFLPLHIQASRPWIEFKNVSKYLEIFPLSDREITRTIVLTLGALRRIESDPRQPLARPPSVDLLPYLKFDSRLTHISDWVGSSPLFYVLNCLRWCVSDNDNSIAAIDLAHERIKAFRRNRNTQSLVITISLSLHLQATTDREATKANFDAFVDMIRHYMFCDCKLQCRNQNLKLSKKKISDCLGLAAWWELLRHSPSQSRQTSHNCLT
jgi:hypothetical protein